MQKMAMGGVPQHIQDSVLAGEDAGSADPSSTEGATETEGRRSSVMESSNSLWEEVVEDDSVEEEVVDDDSAEYEEEYEEESVEEEVVDDSEDEKEEEAEAEVSQQGNEEGEGEGNSEGAASTGEAPETREVENVGAYDESGGDVENQQDDEEYDDAPYQPEAYRAPPIMAPMGKTPEKPLPSPKSCWYWICCLLFFLLVGGGAGVGYWLTTLGGDDVTVLANMTLTSPPTEAPSTSLSTEFDAVQGNCNFGGVDNPNPIDQCDCFGRISGLESDIRDRYLYNREYFIPEYVPDFNDDISSCSPRNQALVWVSSGVDTKRSKSERAQKFALATVFASLGGGKWKNNTNWLADEDVCTWYGVNCTETKITELELAGNDLVGTVSFIRWRLNF